VSLSRAPPDPVNFLINLTSMAMNVSASRFACLPDDFLDDKIKPIRKPKKDTNNDFAFLNDSSGKNKSNKNNKKQPATEADKLRQDAFAAGGGKKKGKKGKNKNNTSVNSEASGSKSQNEMSPPPTSASPPKTDVPLNTQQFQEWKQSDTKNVEDAFERDIEQALMLSMIEAEHDKEIAREREAAKAAIPKKTMSLDEFNRSLEAGSPPSTTTLTGGNSSKNYQRGSSGGQPHPPPLVGVGSSAGRVGAPTSLAELRLMEQQQIQQKADFFSEVDHGAKKIVNREKIRESIHKMHLDLAAQKERDDQEKMVANSLKREEDFRNLASENEALKAELTKVKSRYKTMRGLLDDAEIKSKAELAAEVVKLRSVKDEVVAEVERLTQELEQSKTRVVALENTVKLLQDKRHAAATSK